MFFVQDGYTALMEAVKIDSSEIVELLLKAGADTNVKNRVSVEVDPTITSYKHATRHSGVDVRVNQQQGQTKF